MMYHPNYDGTPYFDVAVIVAEKELALVNNIRPICLPFLPTQQNHIPLSLEDDDYAPDNTPFAGIRRIFGFSGEFF